MSVIAEDPASAEERAAGPGIDAVLERGPRKIIEPVALDDAGEPVRLASHHAPCGALLFTGFVDFNGVRWIPRWFRSRESAAPALQACPVCQAPLTAAELLTMAEMDARIARARAAEVAPVGRGGLPPELVAAMYADYARGASLEEVAALYGRQRQSVHEIFQRRARAVRADSQAISQALGLRVEWEGRTFAPDPDGYLRETSGQRDYLHKIVWRRRHGPVKPTSQICFIDGDKTNCAIENLEARTDAEQLARNRQNARRERAQRAARAASHPPLAPEPPSIAQLFAKYEECGDIAAVAATHGRDPRQLFRELLAYSEAKSAAPYFPQTVRRVA